MKIKRNTEGLQKHAKDKSELARKKVDDGIKALLKENMAINFNTVSTTTGVSKAYLYNQPDIRKQIETLREQKESHTRTKIKKQMTDKGKDVLIAAKNERIKKLEEENRQLKSELKKLRGKLYDTL